MINYTGISESRVSPIAGELVKKRNQTLIIVSTDVRAKRLARDLAFFAGDREIITLYEEDGFFNRFDAKNRDTQLERLKALKTLSTGAPLVVIAPVSCAIKHIAPHESYEEDSILIKRGEDRDIRNIAARLTVLGYERVGIVEAGGQFGLRGGILDIFTPDKDNPVRIEFFGTEVDSIRSFDKDTQRSVGNLESVEVYPARELTGDGDFFNEAVKRLQKDYTGYASDLIKKASKTDDPAEMDMAEIISQKIYRTRDELTEYIENVRNVQFLENYIHYFYEKTEYIWDYLRDGQIIIDDPDRIFETLELRDREAEEDFIVLLERGQVIPKDRQAVSGTEDFVKALKQKDVTVFTPFPKKIKGIDTYDKVYNLASRQPLNFMGKMNVLESELKSYQRKKYEINIVCSTDERLNNLREFCDRAGITGINFLKGFITQGIDFPQDRRVWLSENDIFAQLKKPKHKKFKQKNGVPASFSDLHEGDYVVHENHGIGRFEGIQQLKVEGETKDYIKIKYAGEDMLYVPVEQMDIVQKYIGGGESIPKINRLAGGEWKATKQKAKAAIAVMARDLIDLYAKRTMEPGHSFGEDTVWQKEFEEAFPYEETDDQLRASEEIKADMARPIAMDRLLLGDVGFGKTEVAARAIFKCLSDGRQAAMLVPTTILASQHYYTLKERFENFPFKVEVLSRFRSQGQQKEILDKLSKGQIDLIIGTHRLLSKDVRFQKLGLLVVDEEQRFGVEDKENIKKLKANVDVLTLSATPIPRTLNMSLTGIKDMSLIEEPPEERYPVQTYVMEHDDDTLKEVIERELGRGGQVFVVFNRVRGINRIANRIEELVPEANVAVGHGQMNENALESVMLNFINGETNVLVSTTIVESGLDIPNANTMVVLDADRYGLSQLYQLRGRVGRSNRIAYCYLMYQKDKVLNEAAEKRLKAIREFTEFGSGFKVAMKDLEIRGAGNLLGTAQSGHMMNIGYELYCKMVDNAVRALQGEIVNDDSEETSIEIPVSAYIPESYIRDETLKMEMYKKISSVRTDDDEADITDELIDRFGDVPKSTENLIKIAHIRYLANEISVTRIHRVKKEDTPATPVNNALTRRLPQGRRQDVPNISHYVFDFGEKNGLSPFAIVNANDILGPRFFVHMGAKPYIKLTVSDRNMLDEIKYMLQILVENRKTQQ